MRFGAMNSPLKPLVPEIRAVAELGFDYVEITMDAPEADHLRIRSQLEEIQGALAHHRLGLVCHLPTFVSAADLTASLREASIQELIASLETAKELGAERVVVHPPHAAGLGKRIPELTRKYMKEGLERVLEKALSLGLRPALENMAPGTLALAEPDDFVDIFRAYPRLEMTLDLGHAHINSAGEERSLSFIERYAPRIGHIHASDNKGSADDHLPIGAGNVDFPLLARTLKGKGFDGTITLEVFSPDDEYLVISREKLRAMMGEGG